MGSTSSKACESSPQPASYAQNKGPTGAPEAQPAKCGIAPAVPVVADNTFEVSIIEHNTGSLVRVSGNRPSEILQDFYCSAASALNIPEAGVKLMQPNKDFTTDDMFKSLAELGIGAGTTLTCITLPVAEVKLGMRITVDFGGTNAVNGLYEAVVDTPNSGGRQGDVMFKKKGGSQCISWWCAAHGVWPAGWYLEVTHCSDAYYFVMSNNMGRLPMKGWGPYLAASYSVPGARPAPAMWVEPEEQCPAEL